VKTFAEKLQNMLKNREPQEREKKPVEKETVETVEFQSFDREAYEKMNKEERLAYLRELYAQFDPEVIEAVGNDFRKVMRDLGTVMTDLDRALKREIEENQKREDETGNNRTNG